jgi:hypothetical protein
VPGKHTSAVQSRGNGCIGHLAGQYLYQIDDINVPVSPSSQSTGSTTSCRGIGNCFERVPNRRPDATPIKSTGYGSGGAHRMLTDLPCAMLKLHAFQGRQTTNRCPSARHRRLFRGQGTNDPFGAGESLGLGRRAHVGGNHLDARLGGRSLDHSDDDYDRWAAPNLLTSSGPPLPTNKHPRAALHE